MSPLAIRLWTVAIHYHTLLTGVYCTFIYLCWASSHSRLVPWLKGKFYCSLFGKLHRKDQVYLKSVLLMLTAKNSLIVKPSHLMCVLHVWQCCANSHKPYQPTDKPTLQLLASKKRTLQLLASKKRNFQSRYTPGLVSLWTIVQKSFNEDYLLFSSLTECNPILFGGIRTVGTKYSSRCIVHKLWGSDSTK